MGSSVSYRRLFEQHHLPSKMKGFLPQTAQFLLFLTNFLVFLLGIVTLGFGIWVLVDKPSFLHLFEDAQGVLNDNNIHAFDISIYASAPVILIVVAVIVSLIAFFGCFGALKESKCLLITYFVIVFCILSIFMACIVGAVLLYQGQFEYDIKDPLTESIKMYKDTSEEVDDQAFRDIWNTVQGELRCCGVNNASDWSLAKDAGWAKPGFNKPEGCCMHKLNGETTNDSEKEACRKASPFVQTDVYTFEGCYTTFVNEVKSHQVKIFGAAIGIVVAMFMNLLFAFAIVHHGRQGNFYASQRSLSPLFEPENCY